MTTTEPRVASTGREAWITDPEDRRTVMAFTLEALGDTTEAMFGWSNPADRIEDIDVNLGELIQLRRLSDARVALTYAHGRPHWSPLTDTLIDALTRAAGWLIDRVRDIEPTDRDPGHTEWLAAAEKARQVNGILARAVSDAR